MTILAWVAKIVYAIVMTVIAIGILYELEEGDSRWRTHPIHLVGSWIESLLRRSGRP